MFRSRFAGFRVAALAALAMIGTAGPLRGAESPAGQGPAAIGVGWRGDGSGRYPQADPPVHWGRVAKSVAALRSQASKPKEGQTGRPIPDGVVREWLVLGPVPMAKSPKPDADAIPGEAQWSPDEGEKAGDRAWRKVAADTSTLDLKALFGATAPVESLAYACAYVYCESAAGLAPRWMVSSGSAERVLCNGRKWDGKLEKGWNRLLFRVTCGKMDGWEQDTFANWYLRLLFFGDKDAPAEEQNIPWSVRLPGWGIAQPVIVGDRLFVTANARTLYCLAKQDGRLLWARTSTYADAATDAEKKGHADIFKELGPLREQLAKLDASLAGAGPIDAKVGLEKMELEHEVLGLMAQADPEKYKRLADGEIGSASPTPTSDGRAVYALYQDLLVAFDLDGRPRWVYHYPGMDNKSESHGYVNSPRVIAGKVIAYFDHPKTPRIVAVDATTGNPAWTWPPNDLPEPDPKRPPDRGHGYMSSMQGLVVGGEPLLATPCELIRVSDGTVAASFGGIQVPEAGFFATPIVYDSTLVRYLATWTAGRTKLEFVTLPPLAVGIAKVEAPRAVQIDQTRFPRFHKGWFLASPLYHEGLVYMVSEGGVLTVVDAAKGEVAYQKLLDIDSYMSHTGDPSRGGCGASPTLAGKYIYLFGNRGTCLVIEPGREYRQVAKNRLERFADRTSASWGGVGAGHPESSMSSPVFEGRRMYYRALQTVYAIEEKP